VLLNIHAILNRVICDFSIGRDLYLLEFSPIETEKSRHFNDLVWAYEIGGIRAEFFHPGIELAAPHHCRNL
jgi:hypothetical protein